MSKSMIVSEKNAESMAIQIGFVTGGLSFLLALVLFTDKTAPLFGRFSVGLTAALVAALCAFVVYLIGWHQSRLNKAKTTVATGYVAKIIGYLKTWSLAFIYASIVFFAYVSIFFVFQRAFQGVMMDIWSASTIVALSTAVASYATYLTALRASLSQLAVSLAIFLVLGILASAISMDDPYWWQYHFSSLGAGNPVAATAFNITLIIAGIVVAVITEFIFQDITSLGAKNGKKSDVGAKVLKWLLILIGGFLACVGLFVYDVFPTIHNVAASGMAVLFLVLITILPLLTTGLSRYFYLLSYALLAGLAVCVWLFAVVGYFNLTGFELIAAAIIFSWLVVFIRQIAASSSDNDLILT